LADQRADDLSDMFDFTQKPAAFHALAGTRPAGYFIDQTPSLKPPDD
jgi:hypothetical protein